MEDWGFLLSSQLSPSISTCLKDNGFLVWCKMPLVIAGSMGIDYDYLVQRRHFCPCWGSCTLEQTSSSLENHLVPQGNDEFFGPPCRTGVQIMANHGDHTKNWTRLCLAPTPPLFKPTTHFSPLNPHLGSLNPFICSFYPVWQHQQNFLSVFHYYLSLNWW